MTNSRNAILAVGVAIVVVVAAFGVYLAAAGSPNTGKVSIMVKDLPDDWTHVNVTFSQVQIHQASGANVSGSNESDSNESGWRTLTVAHNTIDLAVLVNVSELLASANVGPGKYTQIRLVVVSVTGTMANGSIVNFTVPSGELKMNHPFNVTAGKTTTLTLDFNLEKSIVHNSQGWKFKPVLGPIVQS